MTDKLDDTVIPLLRSLQTGIAAMQLDVAVLKADVAALKSDMGVIKEAVRRIDSRFSTVDTLVAGIYATSRWQSDELDSHRDRLNALEDSLLPKK